MTFLRAVDVRKSFGAVDVLHGVSLDAALGRVTALIGPNGAGKSTLANIISGYTRADSGNVLLGEHDVTGKRVHQRARLGLGRTFQNLELFDGMSVSDNVVLGRYGAARAPWFTGPRRRDHAYAFQALERLSLAEQRRADVDSLSFGRAKLVEPARVLAAEPRMIVMDEPAAGLTAHKAADLGRWIRDFVTPETGVLLIEHNMPLVMSIADHIYVIDHGDLLAEGPPEEVRRDPKVLEAYLGRGESG